MSAGWPAGYRIGARGLCPDAATIEAFRGLPVPAVGDCMGRSVGAMGLRAFHGDPRLVLCGPAVTVRVRPGDNLMIHKALTLVEPGDVLVIDGGGDCTQALVGGLMRTTALRCRLGGLVIDGALRDVLEWAEGGLPVYARCQTLRGPSKEGPGEINVPVACAGLVVQPGDLILGDADGVIAISSAEAPSLLAAVHAHLEREARIRAANAAGTTDPERFNAVLRAKGLPV